LLGLRPEFGKVIIDPVIPHSMDGLSATIDFMDRVITFNYSVKLDNFSPKKITINEKPIDFTYEENKYRKGGAVIPTDLFLACLAQHVNLVEIQL
jgi:1,2-beta-oligoglucan phosphorylase